MKKRQIKRILRILGIALATPIVLFLTLAILLYIPALQQWMVDKVTKSLSETTGMTIRIEKVRLAFPLDLALVGMSATSQQDTILDARALRLKVELLPLLKSKIEVDGIDLYDAKLNTKDFIEDTNIRGRVGRLYVVSRGVSLVDESVCVNRLLLENSNIAIALSDTAQQDTTTKKTKWKIEVKKADIVRSDVSVKMPGDSMRIGARIGSLALRNAKIDMGAKSYVARLAAISNSRMVYDLPYIRRSKGFDFNHIEANCVWLRLSDFSYREGALAVNLEHFTMKEKSGLELKTAKGVVELDTTKLSLPLFHLRTPGSHIEATAQLQWKSLKEGQGGRMAVDFKGEISKRDILILAGEQAETLRPILPDRNIVIDIEAEGNMNRLELRKAEVVVPRMLRFSSKGHIARIANEKFRSGQISYSLAASDLAIINRLTAGAVNLPDNVTLRGGVGFVGQAYGLKANGKIGGGTIEATAKYNVSNRVYGLKMEGALLPLGSILPGNSLTDFTGSVDVSGREFNLFSKSSYIDGGLKVRSFSYGNVVLDSLTLSTKLRGGEGIVDLAVTNGVFDGLGTVELTRREKTIVAKIATQIKNIDMQHFSGGADATKLTFNLNAEAYADENGKRVGVDGGITAINFIKSQKRYLTKDLFLKLDMTPDTTTAGVKAGDLTMRFACRSNVGGLMEQVNRFVEEYTMLKNARRIEPGELRKFIPQTRLYLSSGKDNPIINILRLKGYSYDNMHIDITTHPQEGINGEMLMKRFRTGKLSLDSTHVRLFNDSTGLQLVADIKNRNKDNPYKFDTRLKLYTFDKGIGIETLFKDKDNREGVNIGVRASMVDKGVLLSVYPKNPKLAFRRFEVNDSNYIYFGPNKQVKANLDLLADDGTRLRAYTTTRDSLQDVAIGVSSLNLRELSSALPFFPRIGGRLHGDLHIITKDENVTFTGSLRADKLMYERSLIGNVGLEAVYLPKSKTEHFVNAKLSNEGKEVLLLDGTYDDADGGAIDATCTMNNIPLSMVNGFIADGVIALAGYGDGSMTVKGPTGAPIINGEILPDSAYLVSGAYGLNLKMDKKPISIVDNNLSFDDFAFYSTGKEPLLINGLIDFKEIEKLKMDLSIKARNFELIDAKRTPQSLVYGKVYTDFDGSLKGNLGLLKMRGNLNVLSRTNVSYILKDSPLTVDERLSDLVTFVNFNDTAKQKESVVSTPLGLDVLFGINVNDAARVHCELSSDGQSYIDIEGGGQLTMKYTPQGELSLIGRYTMNSGEMKYDLPVIPLKTFTLTGGSYVSFTGDAFNPTLNIKAKERVKSSVSEDGNSRTVTFDVGIAITKPLDQMGLEFTLEAPEDLGVQNQLAAMSRDQRAKLAVSMLATGMYLAENNNTAFNANNALNAFLQSEIQNIAGNALKTIDLSVGVEDGTNNDGSSRTDYSFRFAKRFWGNRVSIIVGGKVSAGGNNNENQAENFIDNVSLEYRLDKGSSRYVKLFYDRNSQDPLEGQIITTGAGLILRKKTDNLGELFIFRKAKKEKKQGKDGKK